jgi:DNA end-binding protein Ku
VVSENTRTIDIERFVPLGQIDARYIEKPYYIAPRDAVGQEAFAVIRDALARRELVGIGRVILQSRERPIALEPMGKGLRGVTLRYAHEVLSEAEYFAGIPDIALPDEMLQIAEHIWKARRLTSTRPSLRTATARHSSRSSERRSARRLLPRVRFSRPPRTSST